MSDGRARFLGFALALLIGAAGLVAPSRPVFASDLGTYEVYPETLAVRLDLTLETAGSQTALQPFWLEVPLVDGRLPPGAFSAEQAILRDAIDAQSLWPRSEQDEAVRTIDRGFADLESRIDRFLVSLPDRLDARQTGTLGIALTSQDFDFGRLETQESLYDSRRGYVQRGGLVLDGSSFGDGWLVLNLGLLDSDLSFPERSLIWTASTEWTGKTEDGSRLLVELTMEVQAALVRQ